MKITLITVLMCGAVLVALTAATAASAPSAVRRTSFLRPKREIRQVQHASAAIAKVLERAKEMFQNMISKGRPASEIPSYLQGYKVPGIDPYLNSGKRSDAEGKDVSAVTPQASDGPGVCQMFQLSGLLSRQGVAISPFWEFVQQMDDNGNGLLENPEMDYVADMLGNMTLCMQQSA